MLAHAGLDEPRRLVPEPVVVTFPPILTHTKEPHLRSSNLNFLSPTIGVRFIFVENQLFGTLGIKLSSIQTTVDGGSSDAHHRGNLVHRHRLGFVQTLRLFDLLLVKFGGSSALPPAGTSGLESGARAFSD